MNTSLTNGNWDKLVPPSTSEPAGGPPGKAGVPEHKAHKMNEFSAANSVAFWDCPTTAAIGEVGQVYDAGALKKDPSSNGTDRPIVSGRHTSLKPGGIPKGDPYFYLKITGGVPVAFLDGHAELWSIPTFHDNLNEPGRDMGPSALWVCPGDPSGKGGWPNATNRTMTDIMGSN
jgi:prepilin-type processing-associated H-X9-DG protein